MKRLSELYDLPPSLPPRAVRGTKAPCRVGSRFHCSPRNPSPQPKWCPQQASSFVRSPVRRLRLKQLPQMAQGKNLNARAHSARRRRRRGKRRTTEREESDLWNLRNSRGEMLAVHSLARWVGRQICRCENNTTTTTQEPPRSFPLVLPAACCVEEVDRLAPGSLPRWLESVACPYCLLSLPPYLARCLSVMRQCVFFVFS